MSFAMPQSVYRALANTCMVGVLALASSSARADAVWQLASYACDRGHDQVSVVLREAENDQGRSMVESKGRDEWDPWSLVIMADDDHIGRVLEVERTCELSDGTYWVTVRAAPENFNLQGQCGRSMGVEVRVKRNGEAGFSALLGQTCRSPDTASQGLTFHAGTQQPELSGY